MRQTCRSLSTLLLVTVVLSGCTGSSSSAGGGAASPSSTSAPSSTDQRVERALVLPALHAEPDVSEGGRIVDAEGREVLLRGVNVNALAEYWSGNDFATTFPLTDADIDRMAGIGWNTVRLLVSWSRVEPEPGRYDEAYLGKVDQAIDDLAARGIYTIVDLHQDAWGPTLAARPDEGCAADQKAALGWDGAPEWATLGGEERGTRCTTAGIRETSPAVIASFDAFWADTPGPGGVGIRTRYVDMLAHLATRWADRPEVAGYDLMNEPNAFSEPARHALSRFYAKAVSAMRAAEANVDGGFDHLILFEPPAIWSSSGEGPPPDFAHDDDVVYAPHVYTGGFTNGPITDAAFATAVEEAAGFGGAPVLSGEWGSDPARAGADGDGYFLDHQELQDDHRASATLWTWRESCGDPHKVGQDDPVPWGEFDVDCATNRPTGTRSALVGELTRGYVRAAPGRLERTAWDPTEQVLAAKGTKAEAGTTLVAFVPGEGEEPTVTADGLRDTAVLPGPHGGHLVMATSSAAEWSLRVAPAR